MQRFLIFCGILSFAALYTISRATDSNSPLAQYFWTIAAASGILAAVFAIVILRYIWLIVRDKRNHVFGSQIARRLSRMFALVAVLPALFLLGVSAQFISLSINSWFGNDTREALERSLKLSKIAVEAAASRSRREAEPIRVDISTALAQGLSPEEALKTERARNFPHLIVWQTGSAKAAAERNPQQLPPPDWDKKTLDELMQKGRVYGIENANGTLFATGWLLLPKYNGVQSALFFRQPIPADVAEDAELIESARAKYAELMFAQKGLQTFFLIALLIAAVLAMLLAIAAALYFARRFVEPILQLADGARSVARSDFSRRIPASGDDELSKLARLFNHMTEQLALARETDEQHRREQEAARHYLERVLGSLNAGVITLDGTGSLKTYNASAAAMLDTDLSEHLGQQPEKWKNLSPQHRAAADVLHTLAAAEYAEAPIEIAYTAQDESRILLGQAVRLPPENGSGLVLVFDNITMLVRAQKEAAWGEVAKRLAHEIRNPLTPIQLSAERLAWKLHDKLSPQDAQILTKATDTIIKQVAALKEMVEAFRNYARAPSLKLARIDLNTLVSEILVLYESSSCRFIAALCQEPLPINADATAMRQVLHNLFKNAAEAAQSDRQPEIRVRTRREEQKAVLIVSNNGKPFSQEMLQNAFVPYATDKPTGTGLGLSVVKKIIDEHGGHIGIANRKTGGARIGITLPLITTPE